MTTALDQPQLRRPCRANWSAMRGDARRRTCPRCSQSVYDLSQLTVDEAATLIAQQEGLVGVRLFRRSDGTVITRDCRSGVRETLGRAVATFRRVMVVGVLAAAVLSLGAGLLVALAGDEVRGLFGADTTEARAGSTTGVREVCGCRFGAMLPGDEGY